MTKLWFTLLLLVIGAATPGARATGGERPAVLLIAGTKPLAPGRHDYAAALTKLRTTLANGAAVSPTLLTGWPRGPLHARVIVIYSGGGDDHLLRDEGARRALRVALDQGAGLVALHSTLDAQGDAAAALEGWLNARPASSPARATRGSWPAAFAKLPEHPITRGVSPFSLDDEWYQRLEMLPGAGVTPLLQTVPPEPFRLAPEPRAEVLAWAFQRPDGGRSVAVAGGHFLDSWNDPALMRLLANSVLWAAGIEVPSTGAVLAAPAPAHPKQRAK